MVPVRLSVVLQWLRDSRLVDDSFACGCDDFDLEGFASVENASASDVSFFLGETASSATNACGYSAKMLDGLKAGLLFVPLDFAACVSGRGSSVRCFVPVKNPYHAMAEFLKRFASDADCEPAVAATARIHASAVVEGSVGEGAVVGPNCVVMRGASVGAGCVLEANVTIYPNVDIGENCVFQAGAVVGSRGFGFYENDGVRLPVPHLAGVRIGNGCSFGANTVVAAGFVSPTVIGNGCHFDSFVQIAHNCVLGDDIYMASQSGIAGSAVVEDGVEFAGGAQSAGHLTIGKGARIAAKAGVTKSVPAGKTVAGFPAVDIEVWRRSAVQLRLLGKKR